METRTAFQKKLHHQLIMVNKELIDFYYAEYKRLAERSEKVIDSSFEDFKLLGGLTGINAAVGLSSFYAEDISVYYILYTFIVMLLFMATLAIRDLAKVNLAYTYFYEMKNFETQIKKELKVEGNDAIFNYIHNWETKYSGRQVRILKNLMGFLATSAILLPMTFLLCLEVDKKEYVDATLIYLVVSILVSVFVIIIQHDVSNELNSTP